MLDRLFTPRERALFSSGRVERIAANFAGKEALIKAMGRLLGWKEIEVLRDGDGRPYILLSGRTKALLEERGLRRIHISLSHDGDYAIAFVVLEGGK